MLACIDEQVNRANAMKEKYVEHKKEIEKQVGETREQLKVKQQMTDAPEDPDSRMEVDSRERREKKGGGSKVKGLRGSGKTSFWQK